MRRLTTQRQAAGYLLSGRRADSFHLCRKAAGSGMAPAKTMAFRHGQP
ncbi:hypothetical protein NB640_11750 [Oxalobacter vibrioformis]|uniref:Uncharacterized protein n=1 Tax=Oxalobacter vibrioformis TaxID=933080 RepID=A0A9E9LYK1_9BURK|nr:hypothetical protein [Oxalobacter vibrioformis]WAW09877.1 hypothetical protein NB640_11750 [Oxalobacter vibrioformis]